LNNEESHLVKFLRKFCKNDKDETVFSVIKLRCVGLLWSDDSVKEKVVELYDIIQDEMSPNHGKVTCNDRDLKECFLFLCELATNVVYKLKAEKNEENEEVADSAVFKDLYEAFLDAVFD